MPVAPELRSSMLYAVRAVSHRIDQYVMKSIKATGLDYSNVLVIRALWDEDGLSQKEIARICIVTESTLAQVLNTMERANLIVRIADKNDGRVKRIYLTQKARDLRDDLAPIVTDIHETFKAGLSNDEIDTFLSVCEKVHANMSSDK